MAQEQTSAQLVEEIRGEQWRCWQAGERVRAEKFFQRYPALQDDPDCALEVIYGEVMLREEHGEAPTLDEYMQRFPLLKAQLRPLFEVHRALESGQLLDDNHSMPKIPDTLPAKRTKANGGLPAIPGYEILGELGRGGMGIVYRARQTGLNRPAAVKMILAGDYAGPEELARFRTEAEAVGRLQHPNIVAIYEVGEVAQQNGRPYLCMEYVDGGSLAQKLTGAPQPARPSAQFVETLARAMHYAHQQGIVHRDLKPANILLSDECRMMSNESRQSNPMLHSSLITHDSLLIPKITDFGLAKILAEGQGSRTRTGAIMGTPSYMAPEQAGGSINDNGQSKARAIGPAVDVYALGAILYELLTGRPPFRAETPLETLLQVTALEPVPPSRLQPHLPCDLTTICLKCLQKEPAKRYTSALELADDLRRFLDGKPIQARPVATTERLWRWSRRNPILATMTVSIAALVLVIAIGSSIMAVRLNQERKVAIGAEQTATEAAEDATDKLWQSLLAQAEAGRRSDQAGRRHKSLTALTQAAGIRPDVKLRNEAIAAMALVDLRVDQQWRENGPVSFYQAFDPLLERYACSSGTGYFSVRRVADHQEVLRCPDPGPCWFVYPMFSPDGRYLAIGYYSIQAEDQCVIWDLTRRKSIPIPLINGAVHGGCFAFSPDSHRIAVGLPEGRIGLFELPEGKELKRLGMNLQPEKIAFHPDGTQLAVSSRQEQVRILDIGKEKIVQTFPVPSFTSGLAWSGDGRFLAAGCDDTRIYVWNVVGRRLQAVLEGHQSLPIHLAFSHAGNLLASHSWDNTTRLWDPVSGRALVSGSGLSLGFSPDDRRLAFKDTGPEGLQLGLWEVADGQECRTLHHGAIGNRTPWAGFMSVWGVDFRDDSRLLASAARDGVRLWDVVSGANVGHLPCQESVTSLFQPNGSQLLTYGTTGLQLWPLTEVGERVARPESSKGVESGQALHALRKTSGRATPELQISPPRSLDVAGSGEHYGRACWSANGGSVAVVDHRNNQAILLNVARPAERVLFGPYPGIMSIALSPDERWIATGAWKGSEVLVWDTKSGKPVRSLTPARAGDESPFMDFSPDGKWLVAGWSGDYQFWKVGSWQAGPVIPREHEGQGPGALAFSKDGRMLAIAHSGQNVRVVDPDSGHEIATLSAPDPQIIMDLCFNQDGSLLAAATAHHQIQLWDLRKIRRQLATMDLDWDLPPYSPSSDQRAEPIRVTVVGPDPKEELHRELEKLNLAIEQNPDNPESYRQRASIYVRLGDLQKAVADYDEAIQKKSKSSDSPNLAEWYRQRGRLHGRMGHFTKAVDDFTESILRQPTAGAFYFRGWNYERLKEYSKAIVDLQKSLEIDPNYTLALNELAWIYVTGPPEVRSPDKALPLSQKAVYLSQNSGNYRNTLGVAHFRLGQFEAAVDDLQRAIQDNKDGATADDLFFLAMSYHHLGDAAKARDYFDQAMRWWRIQGQLTPFQVAELTNFRDEAASLMGISRQP